MMAIQQRSHKFAVGSAAVYLKAAPNQTFDGITDMASLAAFAERPKAFGCFSTAVASSAEVAVNDQICDRPPCVLGSPP